MNNENVCEIFGVDFGNKLIEDLAVELDRVEDLFGLEVRMVWHQPKTYFWCHLAADVGQDKSRYVKLFGVYLLYHADMYEESCENISWDVRYFTNTYWDETSDREVEFEDYETFEVKCSPM